MTNHSVSLSANLDSGVPKVLCRHVEKAIECFNENETYLIEHDVSERCICAKFAVYLEQELFDTEYRHYNVDVEYNRGYQGNDSAAKMMHGKKIVTDLIVHKRGTNENGEYDNLICIEMKKEYQHPSMESDKKRLSVLTDESCGFCYKLGLMIVARRNKKEEICGLAIDSIYVHGHPWAKNL